MSRRLAGSRGHTLVEFMVACALTLVVMSALVALAVPAHDIFRLQPEIADLQQRVRVAVDVLHRDLAQAGAGFGDGPLAGPLTFVAPAVFPYRLGAAAAGADPPGSFRSDTLSILTLSSPSIQCRTRSGVSPADPIPLDPGAGCPLGDLACGFEAGMSALVAAGHGTWDAFEVTAVQLPVPAIEHAAGWLSASYPAGSAVAALQARVYRLRPDSSTLTPQLVRSDGAGNELPVCEHIVGLRFEYFGSAVPPELTEPASAPAGPRTTYGPRPPRPDESAEGTGWPAGENCVFRMDGERQIPRLDRLTADRGGLSRLDPAVLTDGPWCPGPGSINRYDADLLRVRLVRVSLRVEAASDGLRGQSTSFFARPGSSTAATRFLPDELISFDVALRNLGAAPPR